MKFKSENLPILLSQIFAAILLIAMVLLGVLLPWLVESFCGTRDLIGDRSQMSNFERGAVLGLAYVMLALAIAAVGLLWHLLTVISRGNVFSNTTVKHLTAVSLCCFAEGLLFLLLGYYFQLAFAVAAAVTFVAFCLLVVRNVLAEACRIKAENDFTV